jgi:hypothetical protein
LIKTTDLITTKKSLIQVEADKELNLNQTEKDYQETNSNLIKSGAELTT